MRAYYNEHDRHAAAWLRELVAEGLIAPGDVDERSIIEVQPNDLFDYTQCHFFAGIGGWSYAARLAGWPDDAPLWTGSCPCQPFSAAGKQKGEADARHLWPEFRRLIAECRPAIVAGEQVASALGRDWLAGVRADLENLGYAVGAADLCAASQGAPHIRQRLFWVADAGEDEPRRRRVAGSESEARGQCGARSGLGGATGGMGESFQSGLEKQRSVRATLFGQGQRISRQAVVGADASIGGVDESVREGRAGESLGLLGTGHQGHWDAFDLLPCRDGKARRVESGTFPLVDGLPRGVGSGGDPRRPVPADEAQATAEARVMRLRGYGNAIVPQVAATFLRAYWDSRILLAALEKGEHHQPGGTNDRG